MTRPDAHPLGSVPADRYRTVPQAQIIEMQLLSDWAFEVAAGGRADAVAATEVALENWIALGLGYRRDGDGQRLFDPAEVTNLMTWAGHHGRDPFWAEHYVTTGQALALDRRITASAARLRVGLRRSFDLRSVASGTMVQLRLPLPLPGPYASDIAVTPVVAPSLSAEVVQDRGRMIVRLAAPPGGAVVIGADLAFRAHCPPPAPTALTPAERALYCHPVEGCVRVSPRVRALADELAGTVTDPLAALRAFWHHMMRTLCCGVVHYDQVDAAAACDWVLDSGWFDCQLGSALLVALCRARGIPARLVSGYLLYPLAPTNHYWAEAWIDGQGWLPFDLMAWTLSRGGRDPAWRDRFFGALELRLLTQLLPLTFTGPMSVRFPPAWHMVQTGFEGGTSIAFSALDGTLIYRDSVCVDACEPCDPASGYIPANSAVDR